MLLDSSVLAKISADEGIDVGGCNTKRQLAEAISKHRQLKAEEVEKDSHDGKVSSWRQYNSVRKMKYREKASAFR